MKIKKIFEYVEGVFIYLIIFIIDFPSYLISQFWNWFINLELKQKKELKK